MRIRFHDIGPVKAADLTLGKLTIIAGRNNTGKTYLTYALYGFLTHWSGWPGAEAFFLGEAYGELRLRDGSTLPDLRRFAQSFRDEGRVVHRVRQDDLAASRERLLQELSKHFSAGLFPSVFSSSREHHFRNARIAVELDTPFPDSGSVSMEAGRNRTLSLRYASGQVVCEWTGNGSPSWYPLEMVCHAFFLLLCSAFPEPFGLCAERFGISLFHRELDLAKSKVIDYLQKMGSEDESARKSPYVLIDKTTSRYALPIKDNIDFTRGIPEMRGRLGPLAQDRRAYNDIKDMMGGYYKTSNDDISFKSKARGDRAFEIPLYLASSSARGLSDLYFFLKHIATENHLLIIDEPESHLDTRNQIELARLLSRLVRLGIRVLVTTHSDYLLKEINNLIMLANLPGDSSKLARKLKYDEEDALPADAVRAYVARDGTLEEASIDRFGMKMPMFDETIDQVNHAANTLGFELAD